MNVSERRWRQCPHKEEMKRRLKGLDYIEHEWHTTVEEQQQAEVEHMQSEQKKRISTQYVSMCQADDRGPKGHLSENNNGLSIDRPAHHANII